MNEGVVSGRERKGRETDRHGKKAGREHQLAF